jgi:DNA-binding FadR family transcriptional regulator
VPTQIPADIIDNSSLALDRIRAVIAGLPADGDRRLPTERALVETLGISRRAVRRALEVLEAEDVVWRRQGSGTYAGPRPNSAPDRLVDATSGFDFFEVMEVRLRIEPQLAQMAALRATPEAIAGMREIIQRLYQAHDADAYELWDSALHHQIARSAANRFFLTIFEAMDRIRSDDTWRAIRDRSRNTSSLVASHQQHEAIVEAIAAHDPVQAGEAMLAHIRALNDNVLRLTTMGALRDAS